MDELNYEEMCQNIIKELEDLERLTSRKKQEIKKLKEEEKKEIKEIVKLSFPIKEEKEILDVEDDSFEEAIDFYLLNYRLLREGFNENEIHSLLPRKTHRDYANILLRLSLESTKEIREIRELLKEDCISDSERKLCENLILHEKRKIDYLRNSLLTKEENTLDVEHNNIVLVPTLAGNIRITDDLEHIPNDYYEGFKELIDSIIDGSFKNVKMLKVDSSTPIFEVKAFKIRVVFARLNVNTFALITAFVKKSDTDKLYRESLLSKIKDYCLIEDRLKNGLLDSTFQEINCENVKELWNILAPSDSKTYRKESK